MIEKLLRMESDKVASVLKKLARATKKKALQPAEGQANEDFLKIVAKRLENKNPKVEAIKNEILAA